MDYIDNSLGSNLSGFRSQGYFSNDLNDDGIYKLAINCFENSFFSYEISKRMLVKEWSVFAIIGLIFLFEASLGSTSIVVLIIQLSLPLYLFQQAYKLLHFNIRTKAVVTSFKSLFNEMKTVQSSSDKLPAIIKTILDYETTKSWGSILLCQKIFNKTNRTLSEDWNNLKKLTP